MTKDSNQGGPAFKTRKAAILLYRGGRLPSFPQRPPLDSGRSRLTSRSVNTWESAIRRTNKRVSRAGTLTIVFFFKFLLSADGRRCCVDLPTTRRIPPGRGPLWSQLKLVVVAREIGWSRTTGVQTPRRGSEHFRIFSGRYVGFRGRCFRTICEAIASMDVIGWSRVGGVRRSSLCRGQMATASCCERVLVKH